MQVLFLTRKSVERYPVVVVVCWSSVICWRGSCIEKCIIVLIQAASNPYRFYFQCEIIVNVRVKRSINCTSMKFDAYNYANYKSMRIHWFWKIENITGYLENHCTKHRLVCTHFKQIYKFLRCLAKITHNIHVKRHKHLEHLFSISVCVF